MPHPADAAVQHARRFARSHAPSSRGHDRAIRKLLIKGDAGIRKIAVRFKVGTGTVQRIKAN
jgi:hypothetical protein